MNRIKDGVWLVNSTDPYTHRVRDTTNSTCERRLSLMGQVACLLHASVEFLSAAPSTILTDETAEVNPPLPPLSFSFYSLGAVAL